jgi:hypothetical protein
MKLDRPVAAAFTGALDPFFVVGGLLLYLLKSPRQKRLCDPTMGLWAAAFTDMAR